MEDPKAQIEKYLSENDVRYRGIEHAPAASAEEYNTTLKTRFTQQVKVLLLRYKREGIEGYAVVAIQGHKKVDVDQIGGILGFKKIRLADKDQLLSVTGCKFGELHPFAKLFNLQLLFDKDFFSEEEVYINAGRLDYSIVISPREIERLEKPVLF